MLVKMAAFVAVNLVVIWGAGLALEPLALRFDYNVPKVREMMALEEQSFDTLVLGNSVAQQSFDPTVVDPLAGTSSYNLASGGQGFLSAELILRQYLRHNQAPERVVIGVFVNRFSDAASLSSEIWTWLEPPERALYRERYRVYEESRVPLSFPVFNAVPAFRYRKSLDEGVKYLVAGDTRVAEYHRGFLATRYHLNGPPHLDPIKAVLDAEGLQRVIDVATQAGADVLLYEPPSHPGLSDLTPARSEILVELEQLVRDNPRVLTFQSFNDDSGLTYSHQDWSGTNHLTVGAAERLCIEQLGPWLTGFVSE
jgi:hypothetical protein